MHAAGARGTVAGMKTFEPGLPTMPGKAAPAPQRTPDEPDAPREPQFEPSHHRFRFELGDGRHATLPAEVAEGSGLPDSDLTFELRQHTIAETCTCFRLAMRGDSVDPSELENQLVRRVIRKIGDNADLGDHELDKWFDAIGPHGFKMVNILAATVTNTTKEMSALFQASRRADRPRRRYTYTIPQVALPLKRWAARLNIDARWVRQVEKDTNVDRSHWLVDGKPAELDAQQRLNRDLTFTMVELSNRQENSVADLAEDPDDFYACRILSVMLSIVEIGGKPLGDSPADMEQKLIWLEDIGEPARDLVTGTYAKIMEVDRVALSRFLESAQPLE